MDEGIAEDRIFKSVGKVWENSDSLRKIVEETNRPDTPRESHIWNTRDFLLKYFPSIKVCYVPLQKLTHSDEVETQYSLLRKLMTAGSKSASEARERTWMHYNIQDLSRLYGLAFEHYATSQRPLDFYHAARKDNPNPQDMADHIMNLLRHVENTEDERLVQGFPKVVASTLLNDALRADGFSEFCKPAGRQMWPRYEANVISRIAYDPQLVWNEDYSNTCHKGALRFYEEHAVCSNVEDGKRCICRSNNHDDGHRYSNGGVKKGPFEPRDIANRVSELEHLIHNEFVSQYQRLCVVGRELKKPSAEDIVRHRRDMLADAVNARYDTTNARLWNKLHSYKTCFTCLQTIPDYVLPCGHALCELCVMDFGTASQEQESAVDIDKCVLCLDSWGETQFIQTKPRCAGVRMLTLDGGGVRGILEIAMLLKLEERIGLDLPIQSFFDLVIGTSTGRRIVWSFYLENLHLN
jgi:hypothetical protein